MEKLSLNDEEQKIMKDLEGLPAPEKIGILEDSISEEPEESGRLFANPTGEHCKCIYTC